MKNYVALDLETTGFTPMNSDIIEIGAWKVKNGVVTDKFCTLVRPTIYIPKNVQELTGISMEMVSSCETIEFILTDFLEWCDGLPFLGHNLRFDYDFLNYKGKFLGLDFSKGGTRTGVDTLGICKKLVKSDSHKLEDMAKYFNISLKSTSGQGYHRAEYDSYMTKLLYDRLLLNFPMTEGIEMPIQLCATEKKYGKVVINDTLDFN